MMVGFAGSPIRVNGGGKGDVLIILNENFPSVRFFVRANLGRRGSVGRWYARTLIVSGRTNAKSIDIHVVSCSYGGRGGCRQI